MTLFWKVLLLGVIVSLIAVTIRNTAPGIGLALSLAAAVLALCTAMHLLAPLIDFVREALAVCRVSGIYAAPLLKCAAISILTMIGGTLCRDAGQGSAASSIELAGVAAALYAALPLLETFLHMIGELI